MIRGEFIRQYTDMKRKKWNEGGNMIARRDELHRKLNRDYGFFEEDGSVGIGPGTGIDAEYKSRYDQIESQFRGPYDNLTPMFDDWCRENGITIFEYLLLDNIGQIDDALTKIVEADTTVKSLRFGEIGLKARLFVDLLKRDHLVNEIKRRINLELNHCGYANTRCRKFFAIKPWEFSKHKTIFDYGQSYKSALLQAFGNLKAI